MLPKDLLTIVLTFVEAPEIHEAMNMCLRHYEDQCKEYRDRQPPDMEYEIDMVHPLGRYVEGHVVLKLEDYKPFVDSSLYYCTVIIRFVLEDSMCEWCVSEEGAGRELLVTGEVYHLPQPAEFYFPRSIEVPTRILGYLACANEVVRGRTNFARLEGFLEERFGVPEMLDYLLER